MHNHRRSVVRGLHNSVNEAIENEKKIAISTPTVKESLGWLVLHNFQKNEHKEVIRKIIQSTGAGFARKIDWTTNSPAG